MRIRGGMFSNKINVEYSDCIMYLVVVEDGAVLWILRLYGANAKCIKFATNLPRLN